MQELLVQYSNKMKPTDLPALFLMGLVLVGIRDAHLQQIPIAISSGLNNVTESWLDPCHLQNATFPGQCY